MELVKNANKEDIINLGFREIDSKICRYERKIDYNKFLCIGNDRCVYLKILYYGKDGKSNFYRTYYDDKKNLRYCKDLLNMN